jgi:hypothetical protein
MAHFAELDESNIVTQVIVVHNNELLDNGVESEAKGIAFCQSLFGGNWVQTSYNNNIRKQYASTGYTYDSVNDVFISPSPFASWTLDENFDWQAPTPYPQDENNYLWDEDTTSWVVLDEN